MTIKLRILPILLVGLATLWTTGCNHYTCGLTFGSSTCSNSSTSGIGTTGTTGGTPAAFTYFVDAGQIGGTLLDTAGNFSLIPNFVAPPGPAGGSANMIIVQEKWMFLALSGGFQVNAYSIDSSGALTTLSGSPFTSLDSDAIASDPAGHFLFLLGADNDEVTVFSIDQTAGTLTKVGTYSANVGFAEQVTTDGLGKYLYVTAGNLGTEVAVFSINSTTGALTAIPNSPFAISIAQLTSEPTGKFMLGITGNGAVNGFGSDNHVYVYSITSSGAQAGTISPVAGSPFATTYIPDYLAVAPGGTLIYTFNETVTSTSPMEGFQFNTTSGQLTTLSGSPFTAFTPTDGRFDQSGNYLFLDTLGTLSVVGADTSTGALTSTVTSTIPNAGGGLAWAVTDPN
jgi:6-phosphogluconolactonase (cycloisomerase 2 family)